MDEAEDLVFRQDISKQLYLAIGSAAFAALGVWIVFVGGLGGFGETWRGTVVGWLSLITGAVFLVNAVGQMIAPATLVVKADGFSVQRWRGRQEIGWQDVHDIAVWSAGATNMVIWRLKDGVQTTDVMAAINQRFGYDGALGTGWQAPARSIVARMNEYKARFEARAA